MAMRDDWESQRAAEGGRVVLGGTVRSWAEKMAVIGAARFTSGVRAVEDELRTDPSA
jgi:osmotically-inducible protein OsmY